MNKSQFLKKILDCAHKEKILAALRYYPNCGSWYYFFATPRTGYQDIDLRIEDAIDGHIFVRINYLRLNVKEIISHMDRIELRIDNETAPA